MPNERTVRRGLIVFTLAALVTGLAAAFSEHSDLALWIWAAGTVPVIVSLAISIVRDLLAGRVGVDPIALLSMLAALALSENLAGIVVAVMYASGKALEDFAVGRAERELKSLVDRAPRLAHRKIEGSFEDVPVDKVSVGDVLLVRAGEVVPVDGQIISPNVSLDESAVTGEPIPVTRGAGGAALSGTINAGETFEMEASATAGDSTYAGIVRMVSAAQTAKSPFIRMADRYALLLLPIAFLAAGGAWAFSHDHIRALAVLVAATPCPLILAAPVAFIAGTAQAAHRGVLIKGGGPLEALARTHTVMFDKTGTLTIGGARLVAIETAPGDDADEVLRLAASLEQASQNVVAAAIVAAAHVRGLSLQVAEKAREVMGTGLEGVVGGQRVRVGSHQFVFGEGRLEEWAVRALRRASWRSALSIYVSVDGRPVGALLLADQLRREAPRAVRALRTAGVSRIIMVTGDRADAAETIGAALDLDGVLADRVPSEKIEAVAIEQRLNPTLMVGDGINDAPALAAADVGIAMGARGASASSEAADVVILVDHLDRVSDAVIIARRARTIALQSITVGMGLSGMAMAAAAFGWLPPVAGALTQEVIDVAVILNALRALNPGHELHRPALSAAITGELHEAHQKIEASLDRLRQIADFLDDATPETAVGHIAEANRIVATQIIEHEREDESSVYPRLSGVLSDGYGLFAMSRAQREILHLGKLLARVSDGLHPKDADRYLIRDAQRIIESLDSLVRIHNAQEEDIYESAVLSRHGSETTLTAETPAIEGRRAAFALGCKFPQMVTKRRGILAGALAIVALGGGWLYWSQHREIAIHYVTQKVERGLVIRTVNASGVVSPRTTAQIASRVSGVIQERYCAVGAKVKAGQLCAKIDPRRYLGVVERAKADLATAKIRSEKDKGNFARARAAFEREQILMERRAISESKLDNSRKAFEQALARMKQSEASIAQRESKLNTAEFDVESTNIVSPIDGTVTSRNVELGQSVTASAQGRPLFLIVGELSVVQLEVHVSQSDIGEVKIGDQASFTVASYPDRLFVGNVTQIRQVPQTIHYDIVVSVPNPDLLLKPDMEATTRIVIDRRDNVLRIPDQALRYSLSDPATPAGVDDPRTLSDGWSRVWILRDGKPAPISVQLGLDDGVYTEIVAGDLRPAAELIIGESD